MITHTALAEKIEAVLTDEPQTAAQIAEKLGVNTRSVSTALTWMRSNLKAHDGCGFRAMRGNDCYAEYPHASWHSYNKRQWVKVPADFIEAINQSRKFDGVETV